MGCWKANARSQFDNWSRSYDQCVLQKIFFGPSHDLLLKQLDIAPGGKVLDVGCGTGRFAARVLDSRPDVTIVGLDISQSMLDRAALNVTNAGDRLVLVHGDSEHLPFDDNTFDAVTCVHSFHHYPNQGSVVREMMRVLKDDGQLLVLDANRDRWWGWMVFDLVVTAIEGMVHHCSARQLKDLFESAGLESIVQTPGGNIAPFLLTKGIARKPARVALPKSRAA